MGTPADGADTSASEGGETATDVSSDHRADLGILLVHGIGEQTRGETLTQMAEPIVAWLRDWLRSEQPEGSLVASSVVSAALRPPLLLEGVPAHAHAMLGTKGPGQRDDESREEMWLFAEAWWAPQVLPSALGSFTAWLLVCSPWLALFHIRQWRLCRADSRWRGCQAMLFRVLWVLWSPVLSLGLIAIYLLSLVTIGRLRAMVAGLLRQLSGIVGDAYVKICHPVQRHAMEDATLQAMQWLRPKCKRMAVVAHSQGAAVAHGTLQRPEAPSIDLFATVGSGMVKLSALRYLQEQDAFDRVAALLGPPFLLAGIVVGLREWQLGFFELNGLRAALAPLTFGLTALALFRSLRRTVLEAFDSVRNPPARVAFARTRVGRWFDIVGSHDPVPQGNVTMYFDALMKAEKETETEKENGEGKQQLMEGKVVDVLRSVVGDHTHYWRATASVLPELVGELGRCSGGGVVQVEKKDFRLVSATRRFERHLTVLTVTVGLDLVAIALPLILAQDRLNLIVQGVRASLTGSPASPTGPLAVVDQFLVSGEGLLLWTSALVRPMSSDTAKAVINWIAAGAALGAAYWCWHLVWFAMWRRWSASRIKAASVVRPTQASTTPARNAKRSEDMVAALPSLMLNSAFLSFTSLPLAVSVMWTLRPDWVTEAGVYVLLGAMPMVVFFVVVVFMFVVHFTERLAPLEEALNASGGRILQWPVLREGAYWACTVLAGGAFAWILVGPWVGVESSGDTPLFLFAAGLYGWLLIGLLNGFSQLLEDEKANRATRWALLLLALLVAAVAASGLREGVSRVTLASGLVATLLLIGGLLWVGLRRWYRASS
jgi:hypothetical protein